MHKAARRCTNTLLEVSVFIEIEGFARSLLRGELVRWRFISCVPVEFRASVAWCGSLYPGVCYVL